MTPEIAKAIDAAARQMSANLTPNYEIALLFIMLSVVGAGVVLFLNRQNTRLAKIANETNDRLLKLHEDNSIKLTGVVQDNTAATKENSKLMREVSTNLAATQLFLTRCENRSRQSST
jgi:hypothetical protein